MAEPPLFLVRVKGKVSDVGNAHFKFSSDNDGAEVAVMLASALLSSPTYRARSIIIRSNNLIIGVGESELPADAFPDLASEWPS
jgi:hypothetical protein